MAEIRLREYDYGGQGGASGKLKVKNRKWDVSIFNFQLSIFDFTKVLLPPWKLKSHKLFLACSF